VYALAFDLYLKFTLKILQVFEPVSSGKIGLEEITGVDEMGIIAYDIYTGANRENEGGGRVNFRKISDRELRCVVSVDEIRANGLEISDLLRKSDKTYEFFEYLVAEGQEETGFEKSGPMSVEGVFMNGSLELIFRSVEECEYEDYDEVDEPIQSMPTMPDLDSEDEDVLKLLQVRFTDLNRLMAFCRLFSFADHVPSSLFMLDGRYVLLMDLDDCSRSEIGNFCMLANEYGTYSVYGDLQASQIMEHGRLICEDALYYLHELDKKSKVAGNP
jgi:negative regulator of genetic competence, sporulation and motility